MIYIVHGMMQFLHSNKEAGGRSLVQQ